MSFSDARDHHAIGQALGRVGVDVWAVSATAEATLIDLGPIDDVYDQVTLRWTSDVGWSWTALTADGRIEDSRVEDDYLPELDLWDSLDPDPDDLAYAVVDLIGRVRESAAAIHGARLLAEILAPWF